MDELHTIAHEISAALHDTGRTAVAAESITAGNVATALAAAPDASEWFSGSIVAYRTATKREVLGVSSDAIVSPGCAREMAEGALRLTRADLVVAITGVGGPDPEEGHPPGTVFIWAGSSDDLQTFEHAFDGSPEDVVRRSASLALVHLRDAAIVRSRAR